MIYVSQCLIRHVCLNRTHTQLKLRNADDVSEEWQHEIFPWSLPLNFEQLEQLYINKNFLLNAQTCQRDPCIETSKVGANWGGEKGEKLRQARDAAFSWELTVGLSLERVEIRLYLALPSAWRSKEIQWAFLQE